MCIRDSHKIVREQPHFCFTFFAVNNSNICGVVCPLIPRSTYGFPGKNPPNRASAHISVIESPINTTRFSPAAGAASFAFASRYRATSAQSCSVFCASSNFIVALPSCAFVSANSDASPVPALCAPAGEPAAACAHAALAPKDAVNTITNAEISATSIFLFIAALLYSFRALYEVSYSAPILWYRRSIDRRTSYRENDSRTLILKLTYLSRSREGVLANIMTTKRKFFGALAGLALASLSPAHAQQYSPAAPANEWVRCHAVTSVPMTADAEQALPMHITGTLPCGAEVSVLSDVEGYTVNVRTADGQTGYVARMYLTAIPAPAAPKPVTSAVVENNIARWVSGGAGSDQFVSDDSLVESLTVNGVTVQVTLHDLSLIHI